MRTPYWILFAFCMPWTITVSYPWVYLMKALGLADDLRWEEYGILTAEWTLKAQKHWVYSTTLGRGIIYQPGLRAGVGIESTRVEKHEAVHVRQFEDNALLGFLIAAAVAIATQNYVLAIVLWWSTGAWQLTNFLTAGLRWGWTQEHMYRDAEHERSAYAQTDITQHEDPASWQDLQLLH